jgi:hypothetical protein
VRSGPFLLIIACSGPFNPMNKKSNIQIAIKAAASLFKKWIAEGVIVAPFFIGGFGIGGLYVPEVAVFHMGGTVTPP